MKRIIGFLLIFSILVCSLSAGFVFSAAYDIEEEEGNIEFSLNFDNEVVNEEDILNVTVKMKSSYESFLLSGIQFDLKYEYNGPARSAIPLSFELIKGDMVYDERFSKEMQIGTKYEGSYFVTTFMSEPEAEFDEDELSITFPFRVKETIYEGQYSFKLEVEDMYYTDLEAPDDMFPSLNFTVEGEDYAGWSGYPIWLGQEQSIILSGDNTEGTPIFIDKEIQSSDEVYIADESVVVFDESRYEGGVENGDEYAFIYVKGIRIDTTEMYIISECVEFKTDEGEDPDSTEDDTLVPYFYTTITAVKIKVTKPDVWFPNIASQPDKTDYFVGEKIDLTGLQFVLGYNNNDVKIVSSGFKVKEYDFSTPGEKEVKVSYTDEYYNTVSFKIKFRVFGLVSEQYKFDNSYAYSISARTSIETFLNNTDSFGQIKIFDNFEEVTQGNLKTGMTIEIKDGENLIKKLTVAVNNDLSGNGRVDIRDLVSFKKISSGMEDADELDLRVLGVKSEAEFNAENLIKLQKQVLGVE